MPARPDSPRLSATRLANHLACKHLTGLDELVRRGELERPHWHDPTAEVLRERGLEHERAYVAHLASTGLDVVVLDGPNDPECHAKTLAAARAGAGAIVQAHLVEGRFHGYADVLLRVDRQSKLGDWSYDVVDTKLAQETRAGTVLQLCLYADLLSVVQGSPAKRMHVVKPGDGFPRETFRFDDHAAYYRLIRERLETFVDDDGRAEVYPVPVPHCDVCRWWHRCDQRRHTDDHLSLVAGMPGAHALELARQGCTTLEAFAVATEPLPEAPRHGSRATYARLQGQAAVQLEGRRRSAPIVELLAFEEQRGLARLPEPTPGDLFLDFEGDLYVEGGGLEYLTGYAWLDGDGAQQYTALWALGHAQEKRAFERFIDFVIARQTEHPGLHVYHYAPYEPSALRRLAMRHATREDELDTLLRGERFVDLYSITRQGLRASVESYSLKPLEEFFGYVREVALKEEASPALRRVACALEQGLPQEIQPEDQRHVEGYNRDDCLSLIALQRWLEGKRAELLAGGAEFERPPLKDGAASEGVEERSEKVREVFDRLVLGMPDDPRERTAEQKARWLLAYLLEYFNREDKVAWWEYFAQRDAEPEDLVQDRKAIVDLEFVEDLGKPSKRELPVHRYRFPPQEVSLKPGTKLRDLFADLDEAQLKVGSVYRCDPDAGVLEIKRSEESLEHHPTHVHECDQVPREPVAGALLDFGRWVAENGVDADSVELRAGRDLLLQRVPRLRAGRAMPTEPGTDSLATALELARDMDGGLLAIQGPPGTGKTHTGARMILGLVQQGKRVGVTATSHKVIRNLLEKVLEAASEAQVDVRVVHKPSSRSKPDPPVDGMRHTKKTVDALAALDAGEVVGGVAWLWCNADSAGALDYLFVDEAGQMSLAFVLACSRAARNVVLLGDPLQLQQPQRGAHPEGAEISALDHLLGKHTTMPSELGLFLARTWRLPPALCNYTSEVFYERRLESHADCVQQELSGPTPFAGAGLFLVHAEHEGNQSVAHEEVETVADVIARIVVPGVRWTNRDGDEAELTNRDVLVIAPYNAQVGALSRRLPGIAVGTVDKFQGQERPVVIYSMTSSTAQDAPRGMSFLYDLHRLNVATSRAQCVCVVVGTRALFEPECRTPEQIRWANGVCRVRELARNVEGGRG